MLSRSYLRSYNIGHSNFETPLNHLYDKEERELEQGAEGISIKHDTNEYRKKNKMFCFQYTRRFLQYDLWHTVR